MAPLSTVWVVERLRPYPAFALVGVTLFIWLTRVPLAWSTTTGGVRDKLVPVIPVLLFVVPAGLALVWALSGRSFGVGRARLLVRCLAIWTTLYWAVRLPFILVHDHPVPFKVVHLVLAVISVGAATWAWVALGHAGQSAVEQGQTERQAASVQL